MIGLSLLVRLFRACQRSVPGGYWAPSGKRHARICSAFDICD